MSDRDHARELLEMARGDLNALRGILGADEENRALFSDEVFGFHAQQAAEKILKSAIAFKGRAYPKTHDLVILAELVDDPAADLEAIASILDLNPFAVQYRYESLDVDGDELEPNSVLEELTNLFERIRIMIE